MLCDLYKKRRDSWPRNEEFLGEGGGDWKIPRRPTSFQSIGNISLIESQANPFDLLISVAGCNMECAVLNTNLLGKKIALKNMRNREQAKITKQCLSYCDYSVKDEKERNAHLSPAAHTEMTHRMTFQFDEFYTFSPFNCQISAIFAKRFTHDLYVRPMFLWWFSGLKG